MILLFNMLFIVSFFGVQCSEQRHEINPFKILENLPKGPRDQVVDYCWAKPHNPELICLMIQLINQSPQQTMLENSLCMTLEENMEKHLYKTGFITACLGLDKLNPEVKNRVCNIMMQTWKLNPKLKKDNLTCHDILVAKLNLFFRNEDNDKFVKEHKAVRAFILKNRRHVELIYSMNKTINRYINKEKKSQLLALKDYLLNCIEKLNYNINYAERVYNRTYDEEIPDQALCSIQ